MKRDKEQRDLPDYPNPDVEPQKPSEGPVTQPKPEK